MGIIYNDLQAVFQLIQNSVAMNEKSTNLDVSPDL